MMAFLQKIAVGVTALFTAVSGALIQSRTVAITPPAPQGTAAIYNAVSAITPPSVATSTLSITPGLLPTVKLTPKKPSVVASKPKPAAIPASIPASKPPAPLALTTQGLLDGAVLSFKQRPDGAYEAVFSTNGGGGKNVQWDLSQAFIGGDGRIPKLSVSYSCNPPPGLPSPTEIIDTNPFFSVRTPYDCDISLTPTTGVDQRTRSRHFTFTTGAGPLVVKPPTSMNTLLKDDANSGGFVFANQDAEPITITKLAVDVSFTALSTLGGPLVLRFLDPGTETSLADYHMENFSAISPRPFTYGATGIEISLSFTVGPSSQKLLPVQVLGVHKMSISGIDPTITITLRGIVTDRAECKVVLNAPEIKWSCVVALGAYDPNATSGPFATGQACRE
jgi:hypothetical protein